MKNETQVRGHCQCCGNLQAVPRGFMSKHGYTVKYGWFSGVCNGENFRPVEVDRSRLDATVAQVRAECAELLASAARMEAGTAFPIGKPVERRVNGQWETFVTPYAELSAYEQRELVRNEVWKARRRAESGESFAAYLEKIADQFHGKPLVEVARPQAAAPIVPGARKVSESGAVLTAKYQERARVYFSYTRENGKTFTGWIGSQAWRRLPDAPAPASN